VRCRCTSCGSGALFRVVYDDSYAADYTLLRAAKSFGERKYDVFERNCEHSTIWCKTGIRDSVQMDVCFTSAGKAALVILLRLVSVLILWLLQLSHESQAPDRRSRRQERLVNAVYMTFIAVLLFAYSLHQGVARVLPTAPKRRRHDTDFCGVETARRRCADCTYRRCCCCRLPMSNKIVLAMCCVSCFFCSLTDACCSICRKQVQCGLRTLCRRPSSIVVGLFFRVFVREAIAAAGPLLVLYFEPEIASRFGATVERAVVIVAAIVGASVRCRRTAEQTVDVVANTATGTQIHLANQLGSFVSILY